MNFKKYVLPSIRINNLKNAPIKIGEYWEKYLSLNLQNTITYAFYFNYESNYKGDYDFTIGGENYFPNSISISINEDNYKIFKCNLSTIIDTWRTIWSLEEIGELQRSYNIDFEKHHNDGTIEIYISILQK